LEHAGAPVVGTLLAVHGNPTWSYFFRGITHALTAGAGPDTPAWRVIAVDQLEMGFSSRTGRPRTLADRVADLSALTAAPQIATPVVTLGHDWGGVVSLGWANDHRDSLAGVILTNTAVHRPAGEPIPAGLRLALTRGLHRGGTVTTPAFLATTLSLAHPPLDRAVRRAYRRPYRGSDRRRAIGDFVADIPITPDHPSAPELRRIAEATRTLDVPALLLWG